MGWADLFDRAPTHAVETDRDALAGHRESGVGHREPVASDRDPADSKGATPGRNERGPAANAERNARGAPESDPRRVVADADVLAADLLCGERDNAARGALDEIRAHSWIDLVASDHLLDDAVAVIGRIADAPLAADWRELVAAERIAVDHPPADHPALASAYHGRAAHLLSFDPALTGVGAGVALQDSAAVSVRTPDAFCAVFDAAALYEAAADGTYPGPDRDPRTHDPRS